MPKTKKINQVEQKTNCKFCGKSIVLKSMEQHIINMHKFEPNFEIKCLLVDVLNAIESMTLDLLYIKEESNWVYSNVNEELIQDNLFKIFQENMMKFAQLNLAKEMKLSEFKKSCI